MPRANRGHNEKRDTKWYGVVVNREELIATIERHRKRRKDGKVDPRRVMEDLMGWERGIITDINQIDMKGSSNKTKSPDSSIHVVK